MRKKQYKPRNHRGLQVVTFMHQHRHGACFVGIGHLFQY